MSSVATLEGERSADEGQLAVAREAAKVLREGSDQGSDWTPLVVLAFFFFIGGDVPSASGVAVVVMAILVRDLVEWGAMHALGHSDRNILLLPFLRRSLPADGDAVARWKEAVVVLSGPFVALGFTLVLAATTAFGAQDPSVRNALIAAAVFNAYSLLPFGPTFAGGRLLQVVIFSRARVLEIVFVGGSSLLLLLAGVWQRWFALLVVGALSLLALPRRYRLAGAAERLRERWPGMPARVAELGEEAMRALFDVADGLMSAQTQRQARAGDLRFARVYAQTMRQVHHGAVLVPPSLAASIALLAWYAASLVLAGVTLVVAALGAG